MALVVIKFANNFSFNNHHQRTGEAKSYLPSLTAFPYSR